MIRSEAKRRRVEETKGSDWAGGLTHFLQIGLGIAY